MAYIALDYYDFVTIRDLMRELAGDGSASERELDKAESLVLRRVEEIVDLMERKRTMEETTRFVAHSDWIQYEINFARRIGRPIIGSCPWGSCRVPTAVQSGATEIVGWNSSNIIRAIRQHALS